MDALQRYALSDIISKKITAGNKQNKADAESELLPGDRRSVAFGDGGNAVLIGAVTRTKPRTVWKVTDEAALGKWVQEHHPDKVEMIPVPKEWFVKALLDQAAANGFPVTDDGEEIPGIEEKTGTSYASVKPEPDALERIQELVRSGALTVQELLAIDD
ncbi:hypothetical protein [Glutamicibacter sp. X7]